MTNSGSNNLTGNRPYNYQSSAKEKQAQADEGKTFYVTVTGGDKDVLDTLLSERNPEYSDRERANLLDRQDETFTVAYESRQAAEHAAGLFEVAGAQVETVDKDTRL